MIVNNLNEARVYLPSVNVRVDSNRFEDFFRKAQEYVVSKLLGSDMETLLETPVPQGEEDPHAVLRRMAARLISEHAYLKAAPEMDLQLSEAGFVVQSNDSVSPASVQRVDRLIASLDNRIADDSDALVRFLLKTSGEGGQYENWRTSNQFIRLTSAFVPYFSLMNGYACRPIDMKWTDFIEKASMMATGLKAVASSYVSEEQIDTLLELYRDNGLMPSQQKAVTELRGVGISYVLGDLDGARAAAIRARRIMVLNIADFPAFKHSQAFDTPGIKFGDGTIANGL